MNEIVSEFKQTGLTCSCSFPTYQLFFTVDHIRKIRDGIVAEFTVFTFRPSYESHITWGLVNIANLQSREQFWRSCERLMPLGPDGEKINWERILNHICIKVVMSERTDNAIQLLDLTKSYESPPWLIKDVIYKGEPTVFYGDGSSGKSRLAQAIALSVQTGEIVVPMFEPKERGPVLYWDWESNEERLVSRTMAICAGASVKPTPVFYKRGVQPLRDCVEDVADFCKQEGIILLVVDTMEMSMGGTKEIGGDANDATIRLYSGLRTIGIASLLLDHVPTSELTHNKARRQYGSVYKKNLARNVFEVRPAVDTPGTDTCFHIGVFNTKKNDDGALLPPIGLRVEWDQVKTSYHAENILESDVALRLTTSQSIEQVLKQSLVTLTIVEMGEYTGIPVNKLKTPVSRLLHKDLLFHTGKKYGWKGIKYSDL